MSFRRIGRSCGEHSGEGEVSNYQAVSWFGSEEPGSQLAAVSRASASIEQQSYVGAIAGGMLHEC